MLVRARVGRGCGLGMLMLALGAAPLAGGQQVINLDYNSNQGTGQGQGQLYQVDYNPEIGAQLNLFIAPPQDPAHGLLAPLVQWQQPLPINPQDHFLYFYSFDTFGQDFGTDLLAIGGQFETFGFLDAQLLLPLGQPPVLQQPLPLAPGQDDLLEPWPQPLGGFRYLDPQQDGLPNTLFVGMAPLGALPFERGLLMYGDADPQFELPGFLPPDGPNGELAYVPIPFVPTPEDCVDESLITEEVFEYLRDQETANGITLRSETEVVDFVTVRDRIESWVEADDGFTYVTIVEDFETVGFYRFMTGTTDPKGIVPLAGDYNGDGFVSQADLDLVLLNWGDSVVPAAWVAADQFDGVLVSQNELDGVLLNWGNGTPPDPDAVAIPEPASLVGLALLPWLATRRRRVA